MSAELEYIGFRLRVGASLIDTVLVTYRSLLAIYGLAFLDSSGFAGVAGRRHLVVVPGRRHDRLLTRQATPGKTAISAKVVNARSGARISAGQAVVRYLGYVVSFLPLGPGILWVAFDRRSRGGTTRWRAVVVRPLPSGATRARFDTH